MRSIVFPHAPTAAPFTCTETPEPEPGPGQVRIRVDAVGVGLGLLRLLRAAPPDDPSGAPGPGGEVVGRVTAVGAGVTGFRAGDRAGGVVLADAYAESVLAVPALLAHVPEDVAAADALALVRGGLVALSALHAAATADTAPGLRGRSVLVTGAASGVGHLAVQLARAYGAARVVGVVGSAEKAPFVRGLGAAEVVTYDQPSWGDPVDLVVEGIGGDPVRRGVEALAPYGRLVAYGAGGGTVDTGALLAEHKTVTGFSMGIVSREGPDLVAARHRELFRLHAEGVLRPAHTAYAFTDLAGALALVESRAGRGRVLLEVG